MIVFIGFIYMVQTTCIPIHFSTTHYTLHESCHFQASVNAWAGVLFHLGLQINLLSFTFTFFS
jgi:hypothetical protein